MIEKFVTVISRFNGIDILDSTDVRIRVDWFCVRVPLWSALRMKSMRIKPRNHTNQESRKDTKVQPMSQLLITVETVAIY